MQYRREASSNAAGPSLRSRMLRTTSIDRNFRYYGFQISKLCVVKRFLFSSLKNEETIFIGLTLLFSLSQSEPNVADSFWKSQRKAIASNRTASSRFFWTIEKFLQLKLYVVLSLPIYYVSNVLPRYWFLLFLFISKYRDASFDFFR